MHIARADFEEARLLADAASIHQDLTSVLVSLERLEHLLEQGDAADPVLVEALWTSALVRYVRCFGT